MKTEYSKYLEKRLSPSDISQISDDAQKEVGYLTSKQRRAGMPKPDQILKYWWHKYDICEKECFACGAPRKLYRCHIIPSILGGSNKVSNLHLLCAGCHDKSEGLATYWTWFDNMRKKEWKAPMHHIMDDVKKSGLNMRRIVKYAAKTHHGKYDFKVSERIADQIFAYMSRYKQLTDN